MKLFIRTLVIALAVAGAVATTNGSSAQAKLSKTSAMPIPSCPPGGTSCQ